MNGLRWTLSCAAVAGQALVQFSSASAFTLDARSSAPFLYNGHYYERRHINGEFTGDVISFAILKAVAHGESYNGMQGHLLRIDDCEELDALSAIENSPSGRIFGLIAAFQDEDGAWQWRDGPGTSPPVAPVPACLNILPDDDFQVPACRAVHKSLFWGQRGSFPQQPPSGIYHDFFRSWNYENIGGNGCGFVPDVIIEYEDAPVPAAPQTWGSIKVIYRD